MTQKGPESRTQNQIHEYGGFFSHEYVKNKLSTSQNQGKADVQRCSWPEKKRQRERDTREEKGKELPAQR